MTTTEVFLKQLEGATKVLEVKLEWTGSELVEHIWKEAKNPSQLSLEDWCKRRRYVVSGRATLTDATLKEQKIQEATTISEIPKSATLSKNYDGEREKWDGDLLGAEDIEDPFMLNPGCLHTVSRSQLRTYLDVDKKLSLVKTRVDFLKRLAKIASTKPKCWLCKQEIEIYHIGDVCSDSKNSRPNTGEQALVSGLSRNAAWLETFE